MRIKQGIMRTFAAMLAAGATLLAGASMASAAGPREYDLSSVGTASLSSLTDVNGHTKTYTTPDGTTVTGAGTVSGDGTYLFGIDITINDLGGVNPGDKIRAPFHTTDESFMPFNVANVQSSGYLSVNGTRVFTVKPYGTRQENDYTVMDGLTLTALNAVSKFAGKADMGTTLTATVYPGRSTHFGRTSTALTVGDGIYTIPNTLPERAATILNASRSIGVSQQAGSVVLQMSADSYGWQHAVLSGDQYADAVRKKFDTVRVALAKITPNGLDTEIQSITPMGGFTPDDLAAGYDATTWSNTFIEYKTLADTMKLATLTAADMQSADTVAAKLPEHQAAVVHDGRDWYVAVNFGKLSADPKLPASQSGYGDKATQDLYDNVRAANLPYPSMTANFTVTFNDPAKQQTAKIARSHNTAWGQGLPVTAETKVYDQGWDLGTQPVSAEGSGSAAEAVTGTFDTNGGTAVDSQKVKVGDTLAEPYTQRDGFTFDGWYLDGAKYDFNTPVTRDITLKAGWRKSDVTTAKADLHKRLATGSKNGQYKLTLDVKGTGSPAMRNTTVTDPLSKWVDPAGLADGKGTGITVTKDCKAMTSGYTATYDAKTRTVKVVLPGDLADGATYAVSFEVVLSNAAWQDYMQSCAYPDTGDADTGLNAGRKGYFTNEAATLTWDAVTTVNGAPTIVPSKAAYPKPVATWAKGDAPSMLVNHLPGTGGTASLIPVIAGMGIAIAIASAWAIRRRLA